MNLIYFVVAFILGLISWICTQITWQYAYILFYIFIFLCSWYINLGLLYQEENDSHRKFKLIAPRNILYLIIIGALMFWLRDYDVSKLINKYEVSQYIFQGHVFYKLLVTVNLGQGILLLAYFKFKDLYYNV